MNIAVQFLRYNLLPAMVVGVVAWVLIQAAIHALGIRHGKLRLCLLLAPLIKSTLVLIGLHAVVPWPWPVFRAWHAQAVHWSYVLPVFLLLTGLAVLTRVVLSRRSRMSALAAAVPPRAGEDRLRSALDRVMAAYEGGRSRIVAQCGCETGPERPELRVTDANRRSPLIITEGHSTIVFPRGLVRRLDDRQLEGALAHEVAHSLLRRPAACFSSEIVRSLVAVNPLAAVMASQLEREEEKACDDLAITAMGDRESYAGMLLETYRYATAAPGPVPAALQYAPRLLGLRPILSERVERLVQGPAPQAGMGRQYASFLLLWIALIAVLFQG